MAGTTRETTMENGKKENVDFHEYDVRLTQRLQNNNEVLRKKALKEVDKWLKIRMNPSDGPLRPESFILWKGLFYALWMADKPLMQEQIAQRISSFVQLTCPIRSMEFFKYGLNILCCEWFGIDQLRLDKFLMFVRRFLRNGLTVVKNSKYSGDVSRGFNEALSETVLNNEFITKRNCLGLTMHFTEIFLEEFAKVTEGKIRSGLLIVFLTPFVEFLARSDDNRVITCLKKNIFRYLLEQSNAGQEFEEKFETWKKLGFPGGNINCMQKEEISDDEDPGEESPVNGEKVLDPRAGRVDVILPQIDFKPKEIVKLLQKYRFADGTNSKSRKAIASIISLFEEMSHGNYPLGMKKIDLPKNEGYSTKLKNAVNRMVKFEKKIKPKKRKIEETSEMEEIEIPKVKRRKEETVKEDIVKKDIAKKDVVREKNLTIEKPIKKNLKDKEKTKKIKNQEEFNPDYEFSFERDSGTWYVYNLGNETDDEQVTNGKTESVFSENKWESSIKESSTPKVIIHSCVVLKKPRKSQSISPNTKKVKIDLKLNRSQEVHEHMKQVKSSPGIPFDASKKPIKPLLKSTITTPINPFYTLNN